MYRFMNLKNAYFSHANVSSDVPFRRTCTLCNRTSNAFTTFAGNLGMYRVHSTWLKLEHHTFAVKKKKYKLRGVSSSVRKVKQYPSSEQRARITMLNTKEISKEEVHSEQEFLKSSSSSPIFANSKLTSIGITLMLPPSASEDRFSKSSALDYLTLFSSKEHPMQKTPALISKAAAELILSGLDNARKPAQNQDPPSQDTRNKAIEVSGKELISSVNHLKSNIKESQKLKKPIQKFMQINNNQKTELGSVQNLTKKKKHDDLDEYLMRQRVASTLLKKVVHKSSFVDVNVHSGKTAYATKYAQSGLKTFRDVPYRNLLLEPLFCHAVLEQDIKKIDDLLSMARQFNVGLTMQSYLMCFELIGRQEKSEENMKILETLLKSMEEEGIRFDDILVKCEGRSVLIQRILQAIHYSHPEFTPHVSHSSTYQVNCLSSLNDTSKSKAKCYHSPASGLLSEDSVAKLVDDQIALLNAGVAKIKNISCDLSELEMEKYEEQRKRVESMWRESITIGFQNDFKALQGNRTNFHLSSYLNCIPIEKFVELIIEEVHCRITDSDKQSIGLMHAQCNLGMKVKQLYDQSILERYGILQQGRDAHVAYCKWYAEPEKFPQGPTQTREIWESIVSSMDFNDSYKTNILREWTKATIMTIGKFLYNILLKDVLINQNFGLDEDDLMVPAVYIVFRKTTKGYQKQLKIHPAVHRVFQTEVQPYLRMNAVDLPMVCPPRPWVAIKNGVYPLSSPHLQRTTDSQASELAMAENIQSVPTQQLYPCFDSLNQLGSIPWKVNNAILNVVTEVFKSGGSETLSIPKPPSAAVEEPPTPKGISMAERLKIFNERSRIRQENAEMYSLWCDCLYKLCIAHEFRDRIFWLPHNMDFRGRVYPICPHLQHMSYDMARSLLVFANGEKLGPDGLKWLLLHTVNLTGKMSKDSLDARVAYAQKIMPKILDSAHKPLTGDKWWMESEDPWQTLAACMEIASAIESGDPENFVSHFPVHQDGSCNGLQHYAALGRDSLGAASVNLADSEKPSDVYQCVADKVEEFRAKQANEGHSVAQSLEGFITRKVVKQTVMTTVYGVTRFGAKLQIQGRLKDLCYSEGKVETAAAYLAKLVFQSLGEMFTSSRNIQDWLTQCASGIVKSKLSAVRWTTPLGLPVIQPYFKEVGDKKKAILKLPEHQWKLMSMHRIPVNQKHRNAFSPNFIHSLDSCHMMLTGLHCEQSNITYVSVHDCYWVHAKNVNAMSKICREQFVALHSEPILEDLSKFLIQTFCFEEGSNPSDVAAVDDRLLRRIFSAVPPKGDFDLNNVLKSKYFFS